MAIVEKEFNRAGTGWVDCTADFLERFLWMKPSAFQIDYIEPAPVVGVWRIHLVSQIIVGDDIELKCTSMVDDNKSIKSISMEISLARKDEDG